MAEGHGETKGTGAHTEADGGHGAFPPFDTSTFPSQLVSLVIAFVALYMGYRTRLTHPAVRNAAWILAFSQGVVAIIPLFVTVTVFALVVVGVVVLLIMLMLLLGERSR